MSFPITCTACHKTFTISDEIYEKKVAGRVVTIKCKSCGHGIRIDGARDLASDPPTTIMSGAAVAALVGAVPRAPAVPALSQPLWAVDYPDGQDREFTTAEVVAELERGSISGATLVWREGMEEWLELRQVAELAAELSKVESKNRAAAKEAAAKEAAAKEAAAKEAAAKEAAAKQAAAAKGTGAKQPLAAGKPAASSAVHKPRAPIPTVTGLAGLGDTPQPPEPRSSPAATNGRAQQPSSPELPKRKPEPSSPELPRPRAQQPSSPILSKGSLGLPPGQTTPTPPVPAAVTPTPPFAQAAVTTPVAPTPSPFTAPSPPAPKLPDATPPLPASVAQAVSFPAREKPSFPAPPSAAAFAAAPAIAPHASVEWPEAKSKMPLVIGAIAGALVIGVGVFLVVGRETPPPPSTPIVAAPPAATPTSAPSPTAPRIDDSRPGADTASGSDPVLTNPGTTPGAGFAEMFAAGARKAESKGATLAPTARFDAAATKAPLAQAANDAQACKQAGGPTGKVTVVVTFDPNGKVASATITEAPFAGTPTAACISQALKRAVIPPFSGLPGTVSKTFSIL